jgi:hypothetical protein
MTVATTGKPPSRRVVVQLGRGLAFTVLLLAGAWVLVLALDWPDNGGAGDWGWNWQPHWPLLGVLVAIFAVAVVVDRSALAVRVLRRLGIAALAMVAAVASVFGFAIADRQQMSLDQCRTLQQCQSITSASYGGRTVLVPATGAGILSFTGGSAITGGGGVMNVGFVDSAPQAPARVSLVVSDVHPASCNPPDRFEGVTVSGHSYCINVWPCLAYAQMTSGGLTYVLDTYPTRRCTQDWTSHEGDRLRAILDSMHK